MSPPRRPRGEKPSRPRPPGDDRPKAATKGARVRRDDAAPGAKPARGDERRTTPAKAPRVRKDGSVALGDRTSRTARERPGAKADPARPGARPPRAEAASASRVRRDGSAAPGDRSNRTTRAQPDAREDPARPGARPPRAEAGNAPRVRKDGSVALGDRASRTTRERPGAKADPARASARPPRAEATSGPRIRKDGSVATRRGEGAASAREPQRIAKLLARAGIASRREIERMIAEGRIALNGQVLDTPATILPTLAGVTVDGKPVAAPEAARLFLFHKPTGFLTTAHDPRGRPTIYDRLPRDLPRLMPVGRLDMNTEGLLLLTTDGELKRRLELPASGIPRIYRARAYGAITQDQLEALADGVEIEGVRYGPIDANMERRTGRNMWIEVKITEGKNREVRRVLEYLGLQVSRLIRVAYGPFVLGELPSGEIGEVKQHDLVAFRKTLK